MDTQEMEGPGRDTETVGHGVSCTKSHLLTKCVCVCGDGNVTMFSGSARAFVGNFC